MPINHYGFVPFQSARKNLFLGQAPSPPYRIDRSPCRRSPSTAARSHSCFQATARNSAATAIEGILSRSFFLGSAGFQRFQPLRSLPRNGSRFRHYCATIVITPTLIDDAITLRASNGTIPPKESSKPSQYPCWLTVTQPHPNGRPVRFRQGSK